MAQRPDKIDWGVSNIVEPSDPKKATGFNIQEQPPREYFNWLFNLVSLVQFYVFGQSQEYIVISSDADEQDYATLAAYIADAPAAGDKVLVKETQVLTAQMIIPSDITLRILDGVLFTRSTLDAASVIKLGSNVIIEGVLNLVLSHTGTTAKGIEIDGDNNFGDIIVENSSTGTLTDVFAINASKGNNHIRGIAKNTGGGTLTNVLTDSSTENSNNIIIVDEPNAKILKAGTTVTDINSAELEQLSDRSNADSLHSHLITNNLLANGDFVIAQDGVTYDSATTPDNSDDVYILDVWKLLSDGNDIVDLFRSETSFPVGSRASLEFDIETANKKFGIMQPLEGIESRKIIGGKASLSFKAKRTGASLGNLRAAIISWDSTEDAITSDVVSAWGAEGVDPTLVANWTYENTPSNLALTTDWQEFKIEDIDIDTSGAKNVAIFIWSDDTATTVTDILHLSDVLLVPGEVSNNYPQKSMAQEEQDVMRLYEIGNTTHYFGHGILSEGTHTRQFRVRKRSTPSMARNSTASGNLTFVSIAGTVERFFYVGDNNGGGNSGFDTYDWTADSRL